ncbi:hypothetical protein AUTU_36360 [Aureibacter tunicatorum]|nr:hypothetical protein AUTU_36360 [Aureibacter tunicatorum]
MSSLRFLSISTISFLLLGPIINSFFNWEEKPKVIFAIDNSSSVAQYGDSLALAEYLKEIGSFKSNQNNTFDVSVRTLSASLSDFSEDNGLEFSEKSTNLSKMLKNIQNDFEGSKVSSVILLTDGRFNEGFNPNYLKYNFPVHTIGIGDTIVKPDASFLDVLHNKIAYMGNKFSIRAKVNNQKLQGEKVTIELRKGKKLIDKKSYEIPDENHIETLDFILDADEEGMQHFTLNIVPPSKEYSKENNTRHVYLDVVDGQQKILLLAAAPHPDIKTLRQAIEKNDNYDLKLAYAYDSKIPKDKYDLVILHQLPHKNRKLNNAVKDILNSETPKFFIAGGQSDFRALSKNNSAIDVQVRSIKKDEAFGSFNPNFKAFNYEDDNRKNLGKLPPLSTPFGNINLKNGSKSILLQRIGNVQTQKPLLAINDQSNPKHAVLLGEGIWTWGISERKMNDDSESTDQLISKTVQLLSSKEDKRQFKSYPSKHEFHDNEPVNIHAELYNELFEPVYGQKISINLAREGEENKSYSFINAPQSNHFTINDLPEGIYNFTSSVNFNDKSYKNNGQFLVKNLNYEAQNPTADFSLLRQLSENTGGSFIESPSQLNSIDISDKQGIIYTEESFIPFVNLKWVFFLILFLLTLEWSMRKYWGGY